MELSYFSSLISINVLYRIPGRPGLVASGLLLAASLLLCVAPLSADDRDGLSGSAAFSSGIYNPDLEPRLAGDLIGGAFFFGGFGIQTPWQGKEFGSIPIGLNYQRDRLRLSYQSWRLGIRPSFQSYSQLNDFNYEGNDASINSLRSVEFDSVSRDTATLLGGLRLNSDPSRRRFEILLGARALHISYNFSGTVLNDIDLSQTATVSGVNFQVTGDISQIQNVFESNITYQASGGLWGIAHAERLADKLELRVQLLAYNLSGDATSRRQTFVIDQGARTVTAPSVSFSQRTSQDEFYYELQTQEAKLFINGLEWQAGLYYKVRDDLTVFARSESSRAVVKDSEVQTLLFTTNSDNDPYNNTINGEKVFSLIYRLNYPGSSAPESVRALTFGLEMRF